MNSLGLGLVMLWQAAAAPPQDEIGIQLTGIRIVRTPTPGSLNPRITVETESEFLTTDPLVWCLVDYAGGHSGDRVLVEWRSPLGAVVQQNEHTQINDVSTGATGIHLQWNLLISGAPASFAPGEWELRLLWNNRQAGLAKFRISLPSDSAVMIGSRTLLPAGTVGVPYFFQLTASGGTPPYVWTARKAFPQGLALSSTGQIGGTPRQRGSFRAIIEAKDAAGNAVTRTFGMSVAILSREAHATGRTLLNATESACSNSESQSNFSASDGAIGVVTLLDAKGREGRIEWINPRGEIYQSLRVKKPKDGPECVVKVLPVAGHRPAGDPGDWRVRLLWDGLEVFTLKFTISGVKAGEAGTVARGGRLAILVANSHYEKLPAAAIAAADVDALENSLRQDGFEVVRRADANLDGMRSVEKVLEEKIQPGDTALVYYFGYDSRSGGDDWLLPVNYDPSDRRPIQSKAYSTLRLMQFFEDSKAGIRFIFLDTASFDSKAPREDPAAVISEVDESTALIYCNRPGGSRFGFTGALAEVVTKAGMDAKSALQIELPKASSKTGAPVAILGGGADFVFRGPGR